METSSIGLFTVLGVIIDSELSVFRSVFR